MMRTDHTETRGELLLRVRLTPKAGAARGSFWSERQEASSGFFLPIVTSHESSPSAIQHCYLSAQQFGVFQGEIWTQQLPLGGLL